MLAHRALFSMVMRVESDVYPLIYVSSVLKRVSHDQVWRVKGVEIILYKPRKCDMILLGSRFPRDGNGIG